MALGYDGVVHPPAFAGATSVAAHSPAQHSKSKWQIHRRRDKALRVAAPCLKPSNWTAAISADGAVVAAIYEAARGDVVKRISTVSAVLQHAAVKPEAGVLA